MKAVVYTGHGSPEVVEVQEVPAPPLGPGDVLVRVRAAALNRIDLWVRKGLPRLRLTFPHIPGADAAGVVERVGETVTKVQPGAEVMIAPGISCGVCAYCVSGQDNLCADYSILGEHRNGTYAEFVAVPEANVLPKPARLTFEEAASIPLVFLTAWNMLVTNGRLRFGETVLIWGAGSGVGSAGIQIAKLFNARVIAAAGGSWKLDKARVLGADEGIDHREQDVLEEVRQLTDKRGVDVVFDHVGAATWQTSIKALARGGRLVTCGVTTGAEAVTDIRYIFGRRLSIHGTWMGTKGELHELMRLVDQGRLKPVVHAVFSLEEAVKAQEVMERSEHFGKLVLRVTRNAHSLSR
ncbi:MAG: zinc-binding dehydrogenase [Bacillati bacterium ANGP1]|uniref:Zinc-binding dehydrogenase n=1 Tax=Candidatus Segetimicrobium genomatis TaxID=2569760 RepID=A0A537IF84_9BACT|nr:MAG: zinc-binding dehydrogenase [Terrabacteria group bacterium ANGP1]